MTGWAEVLRQIEEKVKYCVLCEADAEGMTVNVHCPSYMRTMRLREDDLLVLSVCSACLALPDAAQRIQRHLLEEELMAKDGGPMQ